MFIGTLISLASNVKRKTIKLTITRHGRVPFRDELPKTNYPLSNGLGIFMRVSLLPSTTET